MDLDLLSSVIIGSIIEVSKALGSGFLEKVYEKALVRELVLRGVRVEAQVPFSVVYKGQSVGEYVADLLVERAILVELKCVADFSPVHSAQCMNYLRASGLTLCLLVNFQKPRAEWTRIVFNFSESQVS